MLKLAIVYICYLSGLSSGVASWEIHYPEQGTVQCQNAFVLGVAEAEGPGPSGEYGVDLPDGLPSLYESAVDAYEDVSWVSELYHAPDLSEAKARLQRVFK